jgi:regulator of sigma E protease
VLDWTVERDGAALTVPGPHPFPPLVGAVQPRSAAAAAGLRPGDVIVAAEGEPIADFGALREAVEAVGGAAVTLEVWRSGETFEVTLAPREVDVPLPDGGFEQRLLIGVTGDAAIVPATEFVGPLRALGLGAAQTLFIVQSSLEGMWSIVTGAISSCNISGPVGIAQASGQMASQGAQSFVWFIAVLSTAVGLLNLFPIPILDGGHLVFHAWEAVTGRPPSERALRALMGAGLALLLTLMVFALTNDLFCP